MFTPATKSGSTRPGDRQMARDFLKEITTETKPRPMAAIAYGLPGVGKSSMAAAIPNCVFMIDDKEDGINTLKASHLVDDGVPVLPSVSRWEDVLEILRQLARQQHNYKALVVDTLGGLEKLCHVYICHENYDDNWGDKGFDSYKRGYEVALPEWRKLLNAFDNCRDAGMSVMCLSHSLIRPYKNPTGDDYDRFIPDLHHKTWSLTHRWADMVLFLNYYVEVVSEKNKPAKGRGGQDRVMYTEYHAAYEAKNRSALPGEIEMGTSGQEAWDNLKAALAVSRKVGE